MVHGESFDLDMMGFSDIADISDRVDAAVERSGVVSGMVTVSVTGSTASVSTMEFEPALVEDMKELLEKIASRNMESRHSRTWGDDNGFSHLRATLMGPGIAMPVENGRTVRGTWQQIVLIDHDNRPRKRRVRVQVVGEED